MVGVKSLEARADQEAKKLRGRNTAVSELLADVARYLHDIAEAGHLDVTDWRPAREEVLPCKDDFVEKNKIFHAYNMSRNETFTYSSFWLK